MGSGTRVSIVMYFFPSFKILDPLLSLGITAWILYNVYFALRDNFLILLQGGARRRRPRGLLR